MSRKQPQSSFEPKLQPQAAASQTLASAPWFDKVPADSRQALDRSIRSALARGQGPRTICRSLKLFQRYGIRVGAIRRYARQLRAAGALAADGSEDRALCTHAPLTAMPHQTRRPSGHALQQDMTKLASRFLAHLAEALEDQELSPADLSRLAAAFAQQQQAFARLQAQQIARHRYTRQCIQEKRKEAARRKQSSMTLEERVRRIYNIDAPKCGPTTAAPACPGDQHHRVNKDPPEA